MRWTRSAPKESGVRSPSQDAVDANAGPAWHMLPHAGLALFGRQITSL
ncbi:hypothetical protein [Paenibacillus sp. SSG-1]|nr:hypothetical protein [Paenibacillus sp. SSG-1]